MPVPAPIVWFAAYDSDGSRLGAWRSEAGFGDVTSVNLHGEDLWLGSLSMTALGHAPAPL